ncbi:PQQ-dependent sugar dehydrogenase [Janthinobacterium sp.]|uniref:PQQ-dependent sugar dehydrogenase n=1 Tax=Janthinobacterium sp. TaxID=1871054 RepID=UPI00293D5C7C|nr:PQQ-dependent sugar dehydrogenase [Janthinobacterium sp.]
MLRRLLCAAALLPAWAAWAAAADCGGLPALAVTTPAGFCVAVLAADFAFPRGVQPLPNGDVLVLDMGGWEADKGSLWLLRRGAQGYERTQILKHLDRPNGIALGPDGLVYIGVVKRVFRLDPRHPAALTDVIGGASKVAPLPGQGRHLLTALRFGPNGALYVNVGSSSDHCENADGTPPTPRQMCREAEGDAAQGAIREYQMSWPDGVVKRWSTYAHGLRNSMALAFQPGSGALWQAENSRDAIQAAMPELKNDNELPHDELNLIQPGQHYGWPYCYDENRASPEYPALSCSKFRAPARLLPAHAAPLGMVFYTGTRFPVLYRNSLIVGYHGYRQHGHRLVALLPDKAGAPLGKSVDLIAGWTRKGAQGMGAPVDVKAGADGHIYIADDHNGMILRLQYEGAGQ